MISRLLDLAQAILGDGNMLFMLALLAVGFTLAGVLMARLERCGEAPWLVLSPRFRREEKQQRARLERILGDLAGASADAKRRELLDFLKARKDPQAFFLRSYFNRPVAASPRVRELRLREAAAHCALEHTEGIGFLNTLQRAALWIALAAAAAGLAGSLPDASGAIGSAGSALQLGSAGDALLAARTGALIALLGLLGSVWISSRSARWSEDIDLAARRLRAIRPPLLPEEVQ